MRNWQKLELVMLLSVPQFNRILFQNFPKSTRILRPNRLLPRQIFEPTNPAFPSLSVPTARRENKAPRAMARPHSLKKSPYVPVDSLGQKAHLQTAPFTRSELALLFRKRIKLIGSSRVILVSVSSSSSTICVPSSVHVGPATSVASLREWMRWRGWTNEKHWMPGRFKLGCYQKPALFTT